MFEKDKVIVQKFKPFFITTDGVQHEGLDYNWGIANRVRCTIPDYLMIDIKSDGYIKDKNKIMYPLSNVVSIEWKLLDERNVIDNFSEYQVFVTEEKLESN